LVSWDSDALRTPATAYAQTLPAISLTSLDMTEEIKQEAIDQLELDIKFGFENEEELFESIREMFYDQSDFDEGWLREKISDKYSKHQSESLNWTQS
jgi:hypothetical protein